MSELKGEFSGINLNQQEGSREVINLRPKKDGTYHVVGKKKPMTPTIQGIKAVHKHPPYPGVIAYVESEQGEKTIKQVTRTSSKILIVLDHYTEEEFYSMGHYGNILIVCTSVTKYHILWRDDKYEVLPQLKNMKLSVATTEEEYLIEVSQWQEDIKVAIGNYREVVYNKLKEGRVEGMMMARVAMRLYSGEYIMYSYPIFIRVGKEIQDAEFPLTLYKHETSNQLLKIRYLKTAKLKFQIEAQTNLYKDIITSIDVFITKPRTAYLIDEEKELKEYLVGYNSFPLDESNVDDTKNDGTYYLIKTVTPDQFFQGKYSFVTDADTFKAIETKTTLPIDENTNHTVTSRKQFLYNDTNIFLDNTTIFSNGYENTLKHNNDNLPFWRTYLKDIQLKTSTPINQYFWQFEGTYDGQPITVTKNIDLTLSMFMSPSLPVMFFILNKYITYPALGFNKATLYCKLPNGEYKICVDTWNKKIIVLLKNHQTLNLSIGTTQSNFVYELNFNEPFLLTERSFLGNSRNTIRATGTGTPFVLPTPRVYSFGENNTIVLAVSTLQSDISTGQYGLYPLYVFTTGGMFLLSVGHGDVLFDRVSYMNDHRIVGEPVNVLNSVVFYNGSDIYMLSGNEIRTISDDIKGAWGVNELLEDGSYREFLGSSDLVDVYDVLTADDSLSAYMQGAVMVYDDVEKELIISNEAFGFSFVYSLVFNRWHKITDTFKLAFNNYDKWLILSDDQLLSLEEVPGYLKVLLQVNPIKLSSSYFKVRSVRLNCDVINYVGDNEHRGNEFALYIFASVNEQLFKFLNGTQSNNERISKLTLNKSSLRASVKQIITVTAGKLKTGSRIDGIDYAVEEKKSRRLK
jgi:hypothetical protein